MKNIVVTGFGVGDEGKSKVVDYLSLEANTCVRFNGGCNAGHSVYLDNEKYVFHLVPSGLLSGKVGVITNGVVIDPFKLYKEMQEFTARGIVITPDTLKISYACHVTTDIHVAMDAHEEASRGVNKIGTTKTGNGPTMVDKYARCGLRMIDLIDANRINEFYPDEKYDLLAKKYNITKQYNVFIKELQDIGEVFAPFVCDTSLYLASAVKRGGVVFEGAQSALLDIDHSGAYPFVTSGNCIAGYACVSGGFGPKYLDEVVGVAKAYISRVGAGAFPTQMESDIEGPFREFAGEFGATTGRNRKLGYFDLPSLRYAVRLNGATSLAITRMDTLSYFDQVKICDYYIIDGKKHYDWPMDYNLLYKAEPHYVTMAGWGDISKIRVKHELPIEALHYLSLIEESSATPIKYIGVGRERMDMIEVPTANKL